MNRLAYVLAVFIGVVHIASAAQNVSSDFAQCQKRADIRLKATKTTGPTPARVNRAHMVEFMALASKRADLRLKIAKSGHEAAYAEWQQHEGHTPSGDQVARGEK